MRHAAALVQGVIDSARRTAATAAASPLFTRALMAAGSARAHGDEAAGLKRALGASARGATQADERPWFEAIEAWRARLASSDTEVRAGFDFAAAPPPDWVQGFDEAAPVAAPAAMLSIPPLWGRFLFRTIRQTRPASAIELGTGVGLSAAFQAAALELNQHGRLVTIDAARNWGEVARAGLEALDLEERVQLRHGLIQDELGAAAAELAPVDYAFIDAEHQEEPTVAHFEALLPFLASGGIVVFDDILWAEMRRAWRRIRAHDRVSRAIGVGRMGVAVVR